jgi:hydroxymethylpyrimidine/phosphomethylpyrimidine kinase
LPRVEGRLTRSLDVVRPNRGVRFGVSTDAARRLLAVREQWVAARLGVTCRLTDRVEDALGELDGPVAVYDPTDRPEGVASDETIEWGVETALETTADPPAAIVDRGAVGAEGSVTLLAADAEELLDRVDVVLDRVA